MEPSNPFNITKAVDFSDKEINEYWVDFSDSDHAFQNMIKPKSHMPMLILGGKGSGKTHLMRYFSFSLQKIRNKDNIIEGIKHDGYLGVYIRCTGLNARRFSGKNQSNDTWEAIFAYYMELWLSQLALEKIRIAYRDSDELRNYESLICQKIYNLFDKVESEQFLSLTEIILYINGLQKKLDYEINNCALTGEINAEIMVTRGGLIFGIPKIFSTTIPSLKDCIFLYLIDELENLLEKQQRYINTLIREKELPCSFKIGARLYGIKTYQTYSAGEINREGSEYEVLRLDSMLRSEPENYLKFAKRLIAKRFNECRNLSIESQSSFCEDLGLKFENIQTTEFAEDETAFVLSKDKNMDRPYFKSFRKKLQEGFAKQIDEQEIDEICNNLKKPAFPLIEKLNLFLFYREWSKSSVNKRNFLEISNKIKDDSKSYLATKNKECKYAKKLEHFKSDLLAQLLRECNISQKYYGLDTFIEMSWGLPRNLLVLLKQVYGWALFYDEKPFGNKLISKKSQNAGVLEASDWFYNDALIPGKDGRLVRNAINNLGNFLRDVRYSDKPSECSCVSFNYDSSKVSEISERIIQTAINHSLLMDVGQQSNKNTGRKDVKLQLNRMLSPQWDLAIYRRGTINLNEHEINAIFDHNCSDQSLKERIQGMNAPSFRKKAIASATSNKEKELSLPGFENV